VSEAAGAWAACMSEVGFPGFTRPELVIDLFIEMLNTSYDGVEWGETADSNGAAQRTIDDRHARMLEEEIATALADYDCREKVGYDETERRIRHQLQQEFVDKHKAELEAWVAEYTR